MSKKQIVRLNMNDLREMVTEAVSHILSEGSNTRYELNQIGQIDYECSFDQDWYNEWLEDNGIDNTRENLTRYFMEEVEYELTLMDSDTYHEFDSQSIHYEELAEAYGKEIADYILSDCMDSGGGSLEPLAFMNDEVDLSDPYKIAEAAKKVLKHGNYYKDARGYILADGEVVYTPAEHNMATYVNGVKSTSHFIRLGNIRVLPSGLDMARRPTDQQMYTLQKFARAYAGQPVWADYWTDSGSKGKQYDRFSYDMMLRDIERIYG